MFLTCLDLPRFGSFFAFAPLSVELVASVGLVDVQEGTGGPVTVLATFAVLSACRQHEGIARHTHTHTNVIKSTC